MNPKAIVVSALSAFVAAGVLPTMTLAATAPAPCENMLKDVKTAFKDAKLNDADKAKVSDLRKRRASNAARQTTTPVRTTSSPKP